jgi:DNA-binding transcriptional ArsR family regulator
MSSLENPTRRAIITLLGTRELSAGEISDALGRPRPGISHHLSVLLEAEIVHCRTSRSHRYYRLNPLRALPAWDEYLRGRVTERCLNIA